MRKKMLIFFFVFGRFSSSSSSLAHRQSSENIWPPEKKKKEIPSTSIIENLRGLVIVSWPSTVGTAVCGTCNVDDDRADAIAIRLYSFLPFISFCLSCISFFVFTDAIRNV